jgi:hypothetical protein
MIIIGLFEKTFWDFCGLYRPDKSKGDYYAVFWFRDDDFRIFWEMSPNSWELI